MHLLVTTLVFGGRFAEGYCIANDEEQAQGRVFQAVRRICEASPHLRREANITANRIEFKATGATITAIASDYVGAAGANPACSCFDELWGYTSERSRRLWDEMIPSPARKISCRLTTTTRALRVRANCSKNSTSAVSLCRQSGPIFMPATAY